MPRGRAQVAEEDGRAVLRIAGELDVTVAALLERARPGGPAGPAGPGQLLTLDAAHLSFMDISGVRLLFVAYFALGGTAELADVSAFLAGYPAALDLHQRQLAVQAVNERLIDLGRADRLLSVHPTEKGQGNDWT